MWRGYPCSLEALLSKHLIESLGYTTLCHVERILDEAEYNYKEAVTEAIAEITTFCGWNRIPVEEVITLAQEICPEPLANSTYGINADNAKAIAAHPISPFDFLRHPVGFMSFGYKWRFLRTLTLSRLEVLQLQLQNKVLLEDRYAHHAVLRRQDS